MPCGKTVVSPKRAEFEGDRLFRREGGFFPRILLSSPSIRFCCRRFRKDQRKNLLLNLILDYIPITARLSAPPKYLGGTRPAEMILHSRARGGWGRPKQLTQLAQ